MDIATDEETLKEAPPIGKSLQALTAGHADRQASHHAEPHLQTRKSSTAQQHVDNKTPPGGRGTYAGHTGLLQGSVWI